MNITQDLLYLLLLYAVLDKGNRLSVTTGLIIAFVIMLISCYRARSCGARQTLSGNIFADTNGI